MLSQHVPVRTRAEDPEQEDVHVAVPEFELQTSLEGLGVGDAGLRLASRTTTADLRHGIPRASVTRDRKRDFGAPSRRGREQGPESLEKAKLTRVTKRVAMLVEASREPESDRCGGAARLIEAQGIEHASLDPTDLRVRHARSRPNVTLA